MDFSGLERHYLLQVLPTNGAGSLTESRHINRLHSELGRTPEEMATLDERTSDDGTIQKAVIDDVLGTVTLSLSDEERQTIGKSFVRYEARNEGQIPVDDAFVSLLTTFSDEIETAR